MKLNSLRALSVDQWRWAFSAYFRLWLVQLCIKFGSSSWLMTKIELAGCKDQILTNNTESQISKELDRAVEMFESIRLAARCQFWDTDCLPRSIVLADMLNGSTAVTAIVILGVSKQEHGLSLASHAWVELNGQIVAEPEEVTTNFSRVKTEVP